MRKIKSLNNNILSKTDVFKFVRVFLIAIVADFNRIKNPLISLNYTLPQQLNTPPRTPSRGTLAAMQRERCEKSLAT